MEGTAIRVRGMAVESKSKKPRVLLIAVSTAVVAAVTASVLFIYLSPAYSWSSSIRDHDGDGISDARDPMPNNPDIRYLGTATVLVTVQLDQTANQNVSYFVTCTCGNSIQIKLGNLSPGEQIVYTFHPYWLSYDTGSNALFVVSVIATFEDNTQGVDMDQFLVVDGNTYSTALFLPGLVIG